MQQMTGSEVISAFLEEYEVPYVFGNPGTTETGILKAIQNSSNTQYILALQESSVVGIAAGYALARRKPAVINIHTYPGLANSLCNLYNAYCSGIPLFVIAGQQDRKSLIHSPVLSGPLTELASTAVKYGHQVMSADDMAIALQRCYTQSMVMPSGPTFLSIPKDVLNETTSQAYFKKPDLCQACVDQRAIQHLCQILSRVKKGKLAFLLDYEAGAADSAGLMNAVASHYGAHLYASPFHVCPVLDPCSPLYVHPLPVESAAIHDVLSQYETIILFGEKVDTFLYTGKPAVPPGVQLIQVSLDERLSFDYPCDLAIRSDIQSSLAAIVAELKISIPSEQAVDRKAVFEELMRDHASSSVFAPMILKVLELADSNTNLVTEGSSEDAIVQKAAAHFGFKNVYFSPRGGGLGWGMPLATGLSLATSRHSLCFVGDGGSMYAIHSIWTAAQHRIPVVYVCFINHEYKILKDLWCAFEHTDPRQTEFIGLDLNSPPIDVVSIAKSFGAAVAVVRNVGDTERAFLTALRRQGPTFIGIQVE